MAGSVQPLDSQHADSIHFFLKPAIDKSAQNPNSPAAECWPGSLCCLWEDLAPRGRVVVLTPPCCEQASLNLLTDSINNSLQQYAIGFTVVGFDERIWDFALLGPSLCVVPYTVYTDMLNLEHSKRWPLDLCFQVVPGAVKTEDNSLTIVFTEHTLKSYLLPHTYKNVGKHSRYFKMLTAFWDALPLWLCVKFIIEASQSRKQWKNEVLFQKITHTYCLGHTMGTFPLYISDLLFLFP